MSGKIQIHWSVATALAAVCLLSWGCSTAEKGMVRITVGSPEPTPAPDARDDLVERLKRITVTPAAEPKPLTEVQSWQSPFPDYDANLVAKINQRWQQLTDQRRRQLSHKTDTEGVVVLDFKLTQDGKVLDLCVQEQTVDQSLVDPCEQAVVESAPFAAWPHDMRRIIGQNYRDIRFTFHYR